MWTHVPFSLWCQKWGNARSFCFQVLRIYHWSNQRGDTFSHTSNEDEQSCWTWQCNNMLKHFRMAAMQMVYVELYSSLKPLSQMTTSVIVPLPKKKGDLSLMTFYQQISLLSIAAKVYNKILSNRITRQVYYSRAKRKCQLKLTYEQH